MKLFIIPVALMLSIGCANAQKVKSAEVPEAVKTKFTSLYPNVTDVDWEKEDANYEAEFEVNKIETSCSFDATGNLLETETEIEVTALPQTVRDYMATNCPGKKIKEAAKIVDGAGTITYEAQAGGADYIFDAAGAFIRKVEGTK